MCDHLLRVLGLDLSCRYDLHLVVVALVGQMGDTAVDMVARDAAVVGMPKAQAQGR